MVGLAVHAAALSERTIAGSCLAVTTKLVYITSIVRAAVVWVVVRVACIVSVLCVLTLSTMPLLTSHGGGVGSVVSAVLSVAVAALRLTSLLVHDRLERDIEFCLSCCPYSVRVMCHFCPESLIHMRWFRLVGMMIGHEFGTLVQTSRRVTYLWDLALRISRVGRSRAKGTASALLSRTGFLLALRDGLTVASIVVLVLRALFGGEVVGGVAVWGRREGTRLGWGLALLAGVIVVLRLRVVRLWDLLAEWIVWLLRWGRGL
jgi:hypothetical protein